MAIYDTMQFIDNDVSTVGMGMARLDGPVPALRRCPGQALRAAARADHDAPAVGGMGGTAADIAIQAEQMLYTKRMFQERIAVPHGTDS
jgi:ATP-dependent Clp protease protease subunit